MTHYAVLIGNSEFPKAELTWLTSPPKDVEAFAAELAVEGRAFDEVIPLINRPRPDIERVLERVFDSAGKNDLILLYYSGHGLPNNKNNDLYFATFDTETALVKSTAISFENIYRWIRDSHCKRIVILLDCCYSGIAGQVFAKGDLTEQLKILNNKVTSTCLMTAASNDQVALDQAEGGLSLFTKHLINGWRGEADHDGNITFDSLYDYVNKKVIEENGNQVPKKFVKDANGKLILAKSGRDSRKERAEKLRDLLLERASKDNIEDDILTEALAIIRKPFDSLTAQEKLRDELLGKFYDSKNSAQLLRKWDSVGETAQQAEAQRALAEKQRLQAEQEAEAAKRAAAQREQEKQDQEKREAAAKQLAETKRLEAEAAKKKVTEEKRVAEETRQELEAAKRAEYIKQSDDLIKAAQAERAQKEAAKKKAAEEKTAAEEKRRHEDEAAKRAEAQRVEAARIATLAETVGKPAPPPSKMPSNNKGSYAIAVVVGVVGMGVWLGTGKSLEEPVRPPAPAVVEAPAAAEGIPMVKIDAGSFTMGCQSGRDKECYDDEKPAHTVNLSAFEIGKTEVTIGQFRRFVEATNYQTTAEKQGSCRIWTGSTWEDGKGNSWRKTGFSQTDNDPVACVSWDDSQAMIEWLNKTTTGGYRLPSESEWEYACRAGQDTNYCGGNDVNAVAWYGSNSGNKTHQVGGKQANAWGLYEMSGNAWEWCQDWYHDNYTGVPTDGRAWIVGGEQKYRVLRGGSWFNDPRNVRAAYRNGDSASFRSYIVGFRLARTLP